MSDGCGFYRHPSRGAAEQALAKIVRSSRKHKLSSSFLSVSYCLECRAFHVRDRRVYLPVPRDAEPQGHAPRSVAQGEAQASIQTTGEDPPRERQMKSEVDKTIAEKVMEFRLSENRPTKEDVPGTFWKDIFSGNWWHCYAIGYQHLVSEWSPSTNPAQFDEAFRKASPEVQVGCLTTWWGRDPFRQGYWEEAVVKWQLAPLADKAKALADASLKVLEEKGG